MPQPRFGREAEAPPKNPSTLVVGVRQTYKGPRCPICENERIAAMVRKFAKKEKKKVEETPDDLNWNDLVGKFIIK